MYQNGTGMKKKVPLWNTDKSTCLPERVYTDKKILGKSIKKVVVLKEERVC
jgi:hypothetical protein